MHGDRISISINSFSQLIRLAFAVSLLARDNDRQHHLEHLFLPQSFLNALSRSHFETPRGQLKKKKKEKE